MSAPLNYQGSRRFPQDILNDIERRLAAIESGALNIDAMNKEAIAIRVVALNEAAAICESVLAGSNNSLFRTAARICASRIREASKLST